MNEQVEGPFLVAVFFPSHRAHATLCRSLA